MRCVIYDRVSVRDEESQAEHLKRCHAFADAQGWNVVGEHVDTASGFKRAVVRPGFEAVRAMVERREVDIVLAFALSRVGRNAASLLKFVEDCRDHDVKLVSVTEHLDTGSAYGGVIIAVLASVAEIESAMKRERALLGREIGNREGRWSGGHRPYGFQPVKTNGGVVLELDEAEAEHVRRAAEVVLNGGSLNSAARVMNEAGARTPRGGPWVDAFMVDLLTRQMNAPDILTPSTLSRVKRAVAKRQMTVGRRPRYLLTGLARCGICDGKLKGKPQSGVAKYVCRQEGAPLHLSIQAEVADQEVLRKCAQLIPADHEPVPSPDEVPENLAAQLREVEAKLEQLGEQVEAGELSEAAFRGRERRLSARVEELQDAIEKALPKRQRIPRPDPDMEPPTPTENRAWVESLLTGVIIKPGRTNRVWVELREGVDWMP